jgi:hypothetical protein
MMIAIQSELDTLTKIIAVTVQWNESTFSALRPLV